MRRKIWITCIIALFILSFIGCEQDESVVRVGGKNFTEQFIVGNMIEILLEDRGIKVECKLGLASTYLIHRAILHKEVDLYVEYTGTGLTAILKEPPVADPDECLKKVREGYGKEFDGKITWLEPLGYNSTWLFAMKREKAAKLGITKISDLREYADDLALGTEETFLAREDGYPGIRKTYGFELKNITSMEGAGLLYSALAEDKVDIVTGYGTDGQIAALDLLVLEDDESFFPAYHAVPIVRTEVLRRFPRIRDILKELAGKISNQEMSSLCYRVEDKEKNPRDVALSWLASKKFLTH